MNDIAIATETQNLAPIDHGALARLREKARMNAEVQVWKPEPGETLEGVVVGSRKPVEGRSRCRHHGGLSCGPTSPEGKDKARENLVKAREVLAGPEYVEARRQHSIKGWQNRRRREKRANLIRTARQIGCSTAEIAALMRVL